jgi:hypothetical protein
VAIKSRHIRKHADDGVSRQRPHRASIRVEDNEELEALKKRQPKGSSIGSTAAGSQQKPLNRRNGCLYCRVRDVKPAGATRGVKAAAMGDQWAWLFPVVAKDALIGGA